MEIQVAEKENADGSLNVSLDNVSDEEMNAIINTGFIKMLTDSINRELRNLGDKKYMSTILTISVHPIDSSPFHRDAIHMSIQRQGNEYGVEILQNDVMQYSPDLTAAMDDAAKRLMEQTSVERGLGLNTRTTDEW